MFRSVNFTSHPQSWVPIAERFKRDLVASFNGNIRPEYHRYITKSGMLLGVGRGVVVSGVNDVRESGLCYDINAANGGRIFGQSNSANPDALVELPAGNWTFQCRVDKIATSVTNPGFWRTTSGETGTTWVIQNGNSGRPWIRVNGTDILKPTTGPAWTYGRTLDLIVRFVNGKSVDAWWGGKQQQSATHAISANALTGSNAIFTIGSQNNGEATYGQLSAIRFWARALPDGEMQTLARNPWAFYQPLAPKLYVDVAAGAALSLPLQSRFVQQAVNRSSTY